MESVLVIGGSGFIGQHTVAYLVNAGYEVFATHSPQRTQPTVPHVHWVPCDLSASSVSDSWPTRCDHVVYLAQSKHWRQFPEMADDVFAVNLAALHQTAQYALRAGAKRFVVASTGSVYPPADHPARETDVIDVQASRNFYAASKLAAEILLGPYAALLPVIQLRLFFPYGPGQSPSMLMPQLIKRVREGAAITLHGEHGIKANPMAVADVAETIARSLRLETSCTTNVAGPTVLTLREVGEAIGTVVGKAPIFESNDQPPPMLAADLSNLSSLFQWTPPTEFETGLRNWLGDTITPIARAS